MNKQQITLTLLLLIIQNNIKSMENVEEELFNRSSRYVESEIKQETHLPVEPIKLVPDDIVSPSRWVEFDPKDPENYGLKSAVISIDRNSPYSDLGVKKKEIEKLPEFVIRKRHRYTPPSTAENAKEIIMTVVHGTWGRF